jgi:hypothetical protein
VPLRATEFIDSIASTASMISIPSILAEAARGCRSSGCLELQ